MDTRNRDSKIEIKPRYSNERESGSKERDSKAKEVVLDTPGSPETVKQPTVAINHWERHQFKGEVNSSSTNNTPAFPTAFSSSESVPSGERMEEETLKV